MDSAVTQPEHHEAIEFPVNRDSQILHWDETIHWILTPNDIETHAQIQLSKTPAQEQVPARWEMRWSWNPVWRHETCNRRSNPNQITSTLSYLICQCEKEDILKANDYTDWPMEPTEIPSNLPPRKPESPVTKAVGLGRLRRWVRQEWLPGGQGLKTGWGWFAWVGRAVA